jgi:hypothetical protein
MQFLMDSDLNKEYQGKSAYVRIPPRRAQPYGRSSFFSFLKVTLGISLVDAWWDQCVAESECCTLKNMSNSWMHVRLKSFVAWKLFIQESWQILVQDDILCQRKNYRALFS